MTTESAQPEASPPARKRKRWLRFLVATLLICSGAAILVLLWAGNWGFGRQNDQLRSINVLLWKHYAGRTLGNAEAALQDWRNGFRWEVLKIFAMSPPPVYRRLEDIRELEFWGGLTEEDLVALKNLPKLETLTLSYIARDTSGLAVLSKLRTLERLRLNLITEAPGDGAFLAPLTNLRELWLSSQEGVELPPLTELKRLERLTLIGEGIRDISHLINLTSLRYLDFIQCENLMDFAPVGKLTNLESLKLTGCSSLPSLEPFSENRSLKQLAISNCAALTDVSALSRLRNMEHLGLAGAPHLKDISSLSGLNRLTNLVLRRLGVSDLAPVATLLSLEEFTLSHCPDVQDFTPVAALPRLKKLSIRHSGHDWNHVSQLPTTPSLTRSSLPLEAPSPTSAALQETSPSPSM